MHQSCSISNFMKISKIGDLSTNWRFIDEQTIYLHPKWADIMAIISASKYNH